MPSPSAASRPPNPATITPRQFLRCEHRLFTHAKSPPRPRARPESYKRYAKISEDKARDVLKILLRSFQPGDQIGTHDVQKATQWSESHSRGAIRRLKQLEIWPFAPPPETRGRKPKESQHASPQSPHA